MPISRILENWMENRNKEHPIIERWKENIDKDSQELENKNQGDENE